MSRYFAVRGWVLAALFLVLVIARASAGAPLRPAWLLLLAAGIALRLWAGAHLGDHGNAASPRADILATSGPYRFSRNPLYLSNILVAWGLILYANVMSSGISLLLAIQVVLHHIVLVGHEERALLKIHGAAYARYQAEIPRWFGIPGARLGGDKEGRGVPLREALARQGRNVIYALACVGIIWIAAR